MKRMEKSDLVMNNHWFWNLIFNGSILKWQVSGALCELPMARRDRPVLQITCCFYIEAPDLIPVQFRRVFRRVAI